ncbi:MAG: argininosuccinate synthase, partial [Anaerolineales bacterium]|nr:argininosuccinate synthase [Anaerolineales bacterium]
MPTALCNVFGGQNTSYAIQNTDLATSTDVTVTYSSGAPSVKLWAPTAKAVTLRRYADGSTSTYTAHAMTLDAATGVWSVTGDSTWNRQYYLFDVQVYVPALDAVTNNLVTDPYALTLSTDTSDTADPRSQFVNLSDADLKPSGWDSLSKPALRFKTFVSQEYADLIYNGLWFSAFHQDLAAFVACNQRFVTGKVRVKLFKGTAQAVGRQSEFSLYNKHLATYDKGDQFDHEAAKGFIRLWGLGTQTQAQLQLLKGGQG